MAVGLPLKTTYANGDVYQASDVNDTNGTVNLVGQTLNFYAGKNAIINGNFNIWQRGTSITVPSNTTTYTTDRYYVFSDHTSGTASVSRQAFTPGTAPVAGYEGSFFARWTQGTGATYWEFAQKIEDVRTYAGQTVTFSFWAKASASASINLLISQIFGSGGSSPTTVSSSASITTSWARYSATLNVPSISGKTIGTSSSLQVYINQSTPVNSLQIDTWGWQVEAGSSVTAFETATGTIQGELAACQRYYYRWVTNGVSTSWAGTGMNYASTIALAYVKLPQTMRINPSTFETTGTASDYRVLYTSGAITCSSVPVLDTTHYETPLIKFTVSSGLTAGQANSIGANSNNAFLGFNAEL
jgi:hypothetical protein